MARKAVYSDPLTYSLEGNMIDNSTPQSVTNPPDPTAQTPPPSPAASTPAPQTPPQAAQQPSNQPNVSQQPTAPAQPTSNGTVSNAPAVHPSVQKANVIRQVATALAGGQRYQTIIDPQTGATTRTPVPLSRGDIGLAIAMEAITGSLAGLAQRGPGATGRAAEAGFQQVQQEQQQAQQQQEQQAQQDANNQSQALVRRSQAFESAQRAVLNTAQAERYGVESLKDAVAINAPLLASYEDQGAVSESNISQDSLMAGMQSGKYSPTEQVAVPDGFTNINGRYEQTFSIVNNPNAKIPLTDEQASKFAAAGIPGWHAFKNSKVPDGYLIPGTILANANAQLQAINLMKQDVTGVVDVLSKSDDQNTRDLAKQIPSVQSMLDDPQNGPVLHRALSRMQRWVSHSDAHGMDFYQSLQQMAAPSKPDPQNPKQMIPNPDSGAAQTVAGAFGNGDPQKGWAILKAYHDEITPAPIKSEADANSLLANNPPDSKAYRVAQRWIAANNAEKAQQARADALAKAQVKAATDAANTTPGQPDALGFTPNIPTFGGVKEYNKRLNTFKKNWDDLARTEGSYQQFASTLNDLAAGKGMTGAQSVVGLFNAIGLSATPLAGRGFRITENTIKTHEQARGWGQALQAKLLNAKAGDIITPQQLRDYADIAIQARHSQYVNLANEMHSAGLSADAALPTGNGQHIDVPTARIFLALTGNDPAKARAAATAKGWQF